MTLIKSISGIRGTIGGQAGSSLTPIDIVKFTSAFCQLLKRETNKEKLKIVVGRDARISGQMVSSLVCNTLVAYGVNVIDASLSSTPTTEMAVILEKADGGIIITASHNPKEWNALKLLNNKGEFISAKQGEELLQIAQSDNYEFANIDSIGNITNKDFTLDHINMVLSDSLVDVSSIKESKFKVVLDAINSVGGVTMPLLLERLGVECIQINCSPTGDFAHNPEPLPHNLVELSQRVLSEKADLGISVDPDVDRLAFICEDGSPFGEEYTLVACADYVLSHRKGSTVSNLSSTRALRDITEAAGEKYYPAAVGEVNVTTMMHKVNAVIGGEGNGGVIYPPLHYGRDAYMGVALFLSYLAHKKLKMSQLRDSFPQYFISKNRIEISDITLIERILDNIAESYKDFDVSLIDGVKITFDEKRSFAHLRRSNTEPIIRLYCEAPTQSEADKLANELMQKVNKISQM